MTTVLVLGDSVPQGAATAATAWPHRLPDLVADLGDATVTCHGDVGTTLAALPAATPDVLCDQADDRLVVLVHAGHNDAQLSGDEPRVEPDRFRAAATALDRTLAAADAVDRHAFVGLVPLLPGVEVPFADAQPDRSLRYDAALGGAVDTHLAVARPVDDWRERTADGVHPAADGHEYVARRVASWLDPPVYL